eukprot:TRINITY_DN18481_c0_g1_i1.p1 TRINITY_DN18481_c0_g1~~TRINITY_DN18481_c0_g1_i1.p1  ORF type:complete len:300 (-),score=27.68 TRINITY_DN18481_c0_g1_i1:12-911(-)
MILASLFFPRMLDLRTLCSLLVFANLDLILGDRACSNASDLQGRIASAYSEDGMITPFGLGLQGVVDNVISPQQCAEAMKALGDKFVGGTYGRLAKPDGFSALGVQELAKVMNEEQYRLLLDLREHARVVTERTLGLCPGTLGIDFTHFTLKVNGGEHRVHADNCFAVAGDEVHPSPRPIVTCVGQHGKHPYPSRLAASILFLNDEFEGGEFFWADQRTGEPKTIARPKPGRMVVFTSGPEGFHGALPVRERLEGGETRRVALAVWYVASESSSVERVPNFANSRDALSRQETSAQPEL